MQPDKFQITVQLKNEPCTLEVSVAPTTDSVDTYICRSANKEITHVRKDAGMWKQLWGGLDDESIEHIGKEIDKVQAG